jgi:DNA ligase-associated metallophosphoesterase
MSASCTTTVCGETLCLLPERAVWWPAHSTLLIADLHFGKAATLRAHGIAVPRGSSSATLARLDALLAEHAVERVVFLGDFLHTRHSRSDATLRALRTWREQRPDIALALVLGNHDRHAGRPPEDLRIEVIAESLPIGPFVLRHMPIADARGYVIAGHLHPAVRLHGALHDSVQLPCFLFGADVAVLPAFGELTGTSLISVQPNQRVFACAGDRVLPLPARA